MGKRIWVVEDDPLMREELTEILTEAGYWVDTLRDFDDPVPLLLARPSDLILLDLTLPGMSGFDICKQIKSKGTVPILVLTSRDQMRDELHALDLGADEYLTKPCRKERLLARVANVLKRYEGRGNLLEGQGFLLDRQTYVLYIHNRSVVLPRNQGKILEVFVERRDELVTKEQLCMALWDTTEFIDENALQVNLTRLKKTMSELGMGQRIVTLRGMGYRLAQREEAE